MYAYILVSDIDLCSIGEAVVEPEVDLSSFLARQRLQDESTTSVPEVEDDDVDTTLDFHSAAPGAKESKKGKIRQIEWDESLEQMTREKAAADATRGEQIRFMLTHVLTSLSQISERGFVSIPPMKGSQQLLAEVLVTCRNVVCPCT